MEEMEDKSANQDRQSADGTDSKKPLPADSLLGSLGYVQIAFKGQIYILRQTRNDKLILTK